MANRHRPGGVFPDDVLPHHTDNVRRLSELQGDDPLILRLARGHYCPAENQQHPTWQRSSPRSRSPTP